MNGFSDFEGQSAHIGRLRREFAGHAFSHAYLFAGPAGTGKKSVAQLCAMAALCRGENAPCGVCGPCRRVLAGTHPDVHIVEPEAGKRDIGVGVMRKVLEEVSVRSFEGGTKVFLIPQADRMNPQAQNALLKTLEEPPENTVFLLVTDKPSALLSTVASRVRLIRFHPLTAEAAQRRLVALGMPQERARVAAAMSEGCVGQALTVGEETLQARRELTGRIFGVRRAADIPAVTALYKDEKLDKQAVLTELESAVRDILAAQATGSPLEAAANAPEAQAYASSVPLEGGIRLMDAVIRGRMMLESYVSFVSILETILLQLSEEYQKWPW